MIANQVREDKDAAELFGKIGVVVNKFLNIEVEFLGEIPYDVNIPKAIMMQTPVTLAFPTTDAARSDCVTCKQTGKYTTAERTKRNCTDVCQCDQNETAQIRGRKYGGRNIDDWG